MGQEFGSSWACWIRLRVSHEAAFKMWFRAEVIGKHDLHKRIFFLHGSLNVFQRETSLLATDSRLQFSVTWLSPWWYLSVLAIWQLAYFRANDPRITQNLQCFLRRNLKVMLHIFDDLLVIQVIPIKCERKQSMNIRRSVSLWVIMEATKLKSFNIKVYIHHLIAS